MKQISKPFLILAVALIICIGTIAACTSATVDNSSVRANDKAAAGTQQTGSNAVENKSAETQATLETAQTKQTVGLPAFKAEEDYKSSVRVKMLKAGWTPARSEDGDQNCVAGGRFCEEFPELEAGPAAGQGKAIFLWKLNEKIVKIFTVDDPPFYQSSEYEASVSSNKSPQSDFTGEYVHQEKIDDGRHTLDIIFELKENNTAVYRNVQEGSETQKRAARWTWDKVKNQLTVTVPPIPDGYQGQEVKLTFVFETVGKNLKLVKDLPYNEGVGEVYKKL